MGQTVVCHRNAGVETLLLAMAFLGQWVVPHKLNSSQGTAGDDLREGADLAALHGADAGLLLQPVEDLCRGARPTPTGYGAR